MQRVTTGIYLHREIMVRRFGDHWVAEPNTARGINHRLYGATRSEVARMVDDRLDQRLRAQVLLTPVR